MESMNKAKRRLRNYPFLLVECRVAASAYAKCVLKSDSTKLNKCSVEFQKFKLCLETAAKKNKMKL